MTDYLDPQLLFLGVVFLAVVLAVEGIFLYLRNTRGATTRVNKRLQLLAENKTNEEVLAALRREQPKGFFGLEPGALLTYLEKQLTQAGWRIPAIRMMTFMGMATLAVGVVFPLLGGIVGSITSLTAFALIFVFAVALGVGAPLAVLNIAAAKRMKKVEAQFPVALDIFVRGLRSGHPLQSALELLVEEMPDPIGTEFGIVVAEMNYGYELRHALDNLAERLPSPDVQMFVVCVAIQAETGGSLAEVLEGLARVIRDRAAMVMKVRALASEGKMTATMLSILPVGTFAFVFMTQPNFYLDVVDDPLFKLGALGIAFMYISGILIIRRLIDLKV